MKNFTRNCDFNLRKIDYSKKKSNFVTNITSFIGVIRLKKKKNIKIEKIMKKFLLLTLCSFFALGAFAQETEKVPVAPKPSHQGIVTNKFWDNWEISFGAGPATEDISQRPNFQEHGSFWHRLSWEANISATKWLHPVWGLRAQFQGGQFYGYRTAGSERSEHTPYLYIHADMMVNLSNWIGGYREDRVYYAVPFAGFGYQVLDFTKSAHSHGYGTNQEYAFVAGLLNKFRVCDCIDLNLEFKWWLYPESEHALHQAYHPQGLYIHSYSLTAGMTYRFNKRDWHREVIYTGPSAADYAAMVAERDAALAAANAQPKVVERIVEKTNTVYVGGKMVVFFAINKSYLTLKEKIRLDLKADQIKKGPEDKIYHIEGHADPQTGNPQINQRLSDARAKVVYEYLVSQGVKPEQLTFEGKGDKEEPFSTMETNRVAIID